jgi:hypothetical protein
MALSTIGRNQLNTGIDDNADATAITISSGELVGIGETSPTSALHIKGGAGTNLAIQSTAGTHWRIGDGVGSTNGNLVIYDYTDSRKVFEIDTLGRVTIPAQPSFRAVLITSTNTVGNYLVFESVDYNTGNHYNATTGIFTAPVAGRYMVTVQAFNENNISSQLYVRINNVNKSYSLSYAGSNSSGQQYNMMSQHSVFNLAANDTVRVYCNAGEMYVSLATTNSFSCHLLG